MTQTNRPQDPRTYDALTVASHLVGHDGINAIHVASGKRPTYKDIVQYRKMADEEGLRLTVESNALIMRRATPQDDFSQPVQETASNALLVESTSPSLIETHRLHVTHVASRTWHWASEHVFSWQAGFTGIHEGVR